MAEVCVIGAGPAGCVFAARMAQLGHDVWLIERERFPRSRLGESLSPGVRAVARAAGLEDAARRARARACPQRLGGLGGRTCDCAKTRANRDLMVDRGAFDLASRRARPRLRRQGPPARARRRSAAERRTMAARPRRGRAAGRRSRPTFWRTPADAPPLAARPASQTGAPTLAVYAYWRGARLPSTPRIEAGEDAWFWGVPLPNGTYNTLAFVDPKSFRAGARRARAAVPRPGSARSTLMQDCRDAELIGPVRRSTRRLISCSDCVAPNAIRLGDAALAIDPISSSGVQKAIQSALSGAVVANTLLRRPAARRSAMSFYRAQLSDASERHRRWAADHYWTVADDARRPFWPSARQASGAPEPAAPSRERGRRPAR